MRRLLAVASILCVLATACVDEGIDTTTTQPEPNRSVPLELIVHPTEYFPVTPGQLFVLLASPTAAGAVPVAITATVSGDGSVEPQRADVEPGKVAEFTVVAGQQSVGGTIVVDLTAQSDGAEANHSLTIDVVDWPDDIGPLATQLRDRFVTYLEREHPEMGISRETAWTPSITKPQILVVMHYLFFSEGWEMGIIWHVTVPEHAWSRMYLRPRDQLTPTFGLEIPSYLDPGSMPSPWEPPAQVDR